MTGAVTAVQLGNPLPIVTQDDGADFYFAAGHIDPAMFALAVVVDMAADVGDVEALDLLCCGPRTPEAAAQFLATIRHSWWRQRDDFGDDEAMERCEPTDPGAQPFTEIPL